MTINKSPININKNAPALALALELAEQGMYPFPVYKNKTPASPHGLNDGTPNPDEVRKLFLNHPAPLIGVRTGITFDVLDIDTRNGGDKWLAKYVDKIPLTRLHQTRSGGWHYFFQTHKGLRNSHGRIAAGVDVLAGGGAVIWWPVAGFPVLSDAPTAPWPDWLLALTLPPPPPPRPAFMVAPKEQCGSFGFAYAKAALHRAAENMANSPEGQRNVTLNREMFSLLRFVANGALDAEEIASTLAAAALSAGLSRREVESTLASALRARGA